MDKSRQFAVIPALDLKDGLAVNAKAGARAEYRPLQTPFGQSDDPAGIARGLIGATASSVLYVADLDAITGSGSNFEIVRALGYAVPDITLWVDAGIAGADDCGFWLPLGATLVIGSETVKTVGDWQEIRQVLGTNIVLSLDFGAEGPRGPAALFTDADLWPDRIIVMTLRRVGSNEGPDIEGLTSLIARAGTRAIFAAGGVRDGNDLAAIERAGASGALVATALHADAITQKEIAALLRERRS